MYALRVYRNITLYTDIYIILFAQREWTGGGEGGGYGVEGGGLGLECVCV